MGGLLPPPPPPPIPDTCLHVDRVLKAWHTALTTKDFAAAATGAYRGIKPINTRFGVAAPRRVFYVFGERNDE